MHPSAGRTAWNTCPWQVRGQGLGPIGASVLAAAVGSLLVAGGCERSVAEPAPAGPVPAPAAPAASRPAGAKAKSPASTVQASAPAAAKVPSARPLAAGPSTEEQEILERQRRGVLEPADAAWLVQSLVKDSVEYGPTLVVWMWDRSASCRTLVESVVRQFDLPDGVAGDRLSTAVCSFGSDVRFEIDPPQAGAGALTDAIAKLPADASSREVPFTAVQAAVEKYLKFRTVEQREVIFVLVTDEAGDDANRLEQILPVVKKHGMPFYVVGVPAPFGRLAALDPSVEASGPPADGNPVVRQGPESYAREGLQLGRDVVGAELYYLDSGFGPYGLERLCRESGGRFLALRREPSTFAFGDPSGKEWPTAATVRFAAETMRSYAPNYVSPDEYQALLNNKACSAVVELAAAGELGTLAFTQREFRKTDEASLTRMLTQAQQESAKLSPLVDRLYALVEQGEADRAKVTERRWQAHFDLALGVLAGAKAKVDGYNHMLAALKRGRPFTQATSTTWILEPAPTLEGASALQKLLDKSRGALERVVAEHPGTPWARLAEHVGATPSGWQWVEK